MKLLRITAFISILSLIGFAQHSMHSPDTQANVSTRPEMIGMMSSMHGQMMSDMQNHMQMMEGMHTQMMGNMQMSMSSHSMLAGLSGKDLEVAFLSMMIEHHEGAIEMANWILKLSTNPEITKAAEAILAAQDPEIKQMTQWLQEWYAQGIDEHSAAMMKSEMDMMMTEMGKAENPEKAFLYHMSLHHNSAIDMAQSILLNGDHAELRELAKNIILVQTQEIAQYQEWLRN